MYKILMLWVTWLVLSACSSIEKPAPEVTQPPSNVAYAAVLEQAVRTANTQVPYGQHPLQFGQLWLPESDKPAPVVVFVHGGCWLNAFDLTHGNAFASALVENGYAVWSIEYRRTGDEGGGWPNSLYDVRAGMAHLTKLNHPALNLQQVQLVGHSAGGHLALLAGSGNPPVEIKQIIGLAAITDVAAYALGDNSCQRAATGFMGGSPEALGQQYQDANPQLKGYTVPVLLLHGSEDAIVPPQQATTSPFRTRMASGAGHFDWIHPQTTAFDILLDELSKGKE